MPCFPAGAQPSENDGTRAVFRVSDAIDEASWGAKASSRTAGVLTLSISSAPSAPIGHYTLFLDQEGQRQVKLGQFVLLYNPWCPSEWQCILNNTRAPRLTYLFWQELWDVFCCCFLLPPPPPPLCACVHHRRFSVFGWWGQTGRVRPVSGWPNICD